MAIHELTTVIEWNGTPQGSVSIRFDRFDGDRCQYLWTVRDEAGAELGSGDDLRSGSGAEPDYAEMTGALLDFLAAAGESYRHHLSFPTDEPDYHGFSERVAEWAYYVSDELTMAKAELIGRERAGF
jgi:hypothetical protein